jgi:type III secretory pathway component EscS
MGFIIFMVIVFILMFCAAGWMGFALFLSGAKSKKKA